MLHNYMHINLILNINYFNFELVYG